MSTVEKSIEIKVPVSVAYNQWTQFEKFPEFMEGIEQVKQLTDKTLFWSAEIGNKDKEWNAEITEQIPDQRIAWRSTTGARNDGIISFTAIDANTTRLDVKMTYEPEGVIENIGNALGVFSHRVQGDIERFKDFIEDRGTATGAWRGKIQNGQVINNDSGLNNHMNNPTMATLDPGISSLNTNDINKNLTGNNDRLDTYSSHHNSDMDKGSTIGTPNSSLNLGYTTSSKVDVGTSADLRNTNNTGFNNPANGINNSMSNNTNNLDNNLTQDKTTSSLKTPLNGASNTTSGVNPANSYKAGDSLNATRGSLLDDDGEMDKKTSI